ncbi:ABC transporter substrate-binding protein [Escherichia coli]|uniref:ABC transporter substrate-binding protein n=1 Tax=Escherichia coli TaxID=562 RepID=UPI000944759B|nr:ABC transporter substrate-binding protein [Escherichia coli]OKT10234.1 peptide ABC transporter permease [Escherichia coli]
MKRSISFRPTLLALVLATNFPVAHAAVPKDMLVIGKAADPQTLDPAVTIDNNDWTVTYPSYQRLVQYKTDGDKGSTDVEGDLASSWKASDDQKEWTFTLKDNAKFADGTPVTAEAVKLSFERLLKIGQGPAEAFPKDLKIDAPDEHTVKFTLSQPFAPFLYTLANDGASIINPAVLKEHAADDARGFLAQNTAGSGPFMLKSWQKGQQLVLVPNPHYPGNNVGLPGNRSFYENSEVDKLLRNALATTDQTQRTRDYQQAQKIVIDDAAYVYLFQKNYQLAMNKEVKGFVFNPMLEQVFNINTMSK